MVFPTPGGPCSSMIRPFPLPDGFSLISSVFALVMEPWGLTFSEVVKIYAIDVTLHHNTHYFLGRLWKYQLVEKLLVEHDVFEVINVHNEFAFVLERERRNLIGTQHEMLLGQLTIKEFTLDIVDFDPARVEAFYSGGIYHHSAKFVF